MLSLLGLLMAPAVIEASAQSRPLPKPSLDALLLRVNSYWSMLEKKNKQRAQDYVAPSSRSTFLARQDPGIQKPRVTRLELSGRPDEVTVTVTVKRNLPAVGIVDWPVNEKWIFRNGNWFAVVVESASPFTTARGTSQPRASLSPEEVEQRQKEIRSALTFDRQTFDIGTVRRGSTVPIELKYSLAGNESMDVQFKDPQEDLLVLGLEDRKLKSGTDQTISMRWATNNYDGQIRSGFSILVKHHDVEVPYDFAIEGFVYSPISTVPSQLLFLKNEREKQFVVRNNSKSEARIKGVSSLSGLAVQPLPQVLPPGGESLLTVKLIRNVSQENYRDKLFLRLERPVDGLSSLVVPIVLNYVKPAEKQNSILGLTQKEIDELLQKAKQQPIKP